ncbi:MAG: TetR family transcriptional regulator [Pseudomonadota bacterium]
MSDLGAMTIEDVDLSELAMARRSSIESKVDNVLYATLRVIAEGGIDAVTHRRVAEVAELPVGSLTYHFKSREQMIREAFKRFLDDAIRAKRYFEDQLGGLSLANYVQVIALTSRTDLTLPYWKAELELWTYAARDDDLSKDVIAKTREINATLAELLEAEGVDRPMQSAATLQGVVSGYEMQRLLNPDLSITVLEERLQLTLDAILDRAREQKPSR